MFRKKFADIISDTGMVPMKDMRPLMKDEDEATVSEEGLLDLEFFNDLKFAQQVAKDHDLIFIDLSSAKITDKTLEMVKKTDVVKYRVLPIKKAGQIMTMAIYDPSIVELKSEIQLATQHNIEFILTNLSSWAQLFRRVTMTLDEMAAEVKEVSLEQAFGESEEEDITEDIGDDVIQYVNRVLADAYLKKASDIHFEPYEQKFRIRFRIDGGLIEAYTPPNQLMLPMISRIKIMAQMNISERRRPQDGRIKLKLSKNIVDYRVSCLPTLFGEKVVMRALDSSNLQLDLTKLGLEDNQLKIFRKGIHNPYGMCLVAAPTGAGKTTTLYSALKELNDIRKNISTCEDPVEFNFVGINQVNVKHDIGLNFATALRSFLRQDPDIIMVGEIRDSETAGIAIEAALTGHLVLSTVHTNNAPATITRLINMGIEPFLIASSLNTIVAQRLCRTICGKCKERVDVHISELVHAGFTEKTAKKIKAYQGQGCENCNGTGYKGRIAFYEIMDITPAIIELILNGATEESFRRQALQEGMKTLRMSALTKVAQGITSLSEAILNTGEDKI